MKTIVISAVNLVEAGTLAILKDCLRYLSSLAAQGEYRVIAVVYKRELVDFPHIEYIETQWPKQRWVNRLWYEYVSMNKISKEIGDVYLWFSLHDTSPRVVAQKQAVYCHNSFFAYKWKFRDLFFAPKIALFAIFTKYIYRVNIHANDFLVVQQNWFRDAMSSMYHFDPKNIIVAPPPKPTFPKVAESTTFGKKVYTFSFAGSPNSHKNFEVICKAVEILNKKGLKDQFEARITVKGDENKYAKWLFDNWSANENMHFIGFQSKDNMLKLYQETDCLIFPSKVESWGLPISEFATYHKPMLLADLPYAHETASGCEQVCFFTADDAVSLAHKMEQLILKNNTILHQAKTISIEEPSADSWQMVFDHLLTK